MIPRSIRIAASITIASLCALGGCTSSFVRPKGVTVDEAYGGALRADIAIVDDAPALARPKERPVYIPPRLFAVHVARHVDAERDLLIGDHWVFFKLTNGRWFSEAAEDAAPASDGKVDPRLTEPLRTLGDFSRLMIPVKSKP